jgi:hypothetical protein
LAQDLSLVDGGYDAIGLGFLIVHSKKKNGLALVALTR